MSVQSLTATLALPGSSETLRLAYLHCVPQKDQKCKGTLLLLHGYPQTSYQYRHVLPLLSAKGYRCIAPDYRGAGKSSHPSREDFRKTTMAKDMIALLDHLQVQGPVHVIGHDIGGKIAFALATRHSERFRSVVWGENILPGTSAYEQYRATPEQAVLLFHFVFHRVSPLAEALIEGRERLYIEHFFNKLSHNLGAFPPEAVDAYAHAYSQPGATRSALGIYRAFDEDDRENREWIKNVGKCDIPTMTLNGARSQVGEQVLGMAKEVTREEKLEVGIVDGAGHYIAEENPEGFVEVVTEFLAKH